MSRLAVFKMTRAAQGDLSLQVQLSHNRQERSPMVSVCRRSSKEKVIAQRLELPPDIANGLLFTLMKDVKPSVPRTTVSMVATTPKPLLVKLAILPQGEEPFTIGSFRHKAMHYVVKVEIGGVTGFLARLMGKQPPDTHVWILGGKAPAFVKSEGHIAAGKP